MGIAGGAGARYRGDGGGSTGGATNHHHSPRFRWSMFFIAGALLGIFLRLGAVTQAATGPDCDVVSPVGLRVPEAPAKSPHGSPHQHHAKAPHRRGARGDDDDAGVAGSAAVVRLRRAAVRVAADHSGPRSLPEVHGAPHVAPAGEPPLPLPEECTESAHGCYGDTGEADPVEHGRTGRKVSDPITVTPYWGHSLVQHAAIPNETIPDFTLPAPLAPSAPVNVTVWIPPEVEVERAFLLEDVVPAALRGGRLTKRLLYPRTDTSFRRHDPFATIKEPDDPQIMVFQGTIEDYQKCHTAAAEKSEYYRPALAFMIGDELGASHCTQHRVADTVPVVLRQYAPPQFPITMRHNVLTIPLAYNGNDGYLPRSQLKPTSKRNVTWAWAGAVRHDRVDLLRVLTAAFPNTSLPMPDKKLPTKPMVQLYLQSQFVPNSRGHVSHDCFRLYESSRAGAIPIVRTWERIKVKDTFTHYVGWEGQAPPWVFIDEWKEAEGVMKRMLKDPEALDAKQQEVLDWWDRTVNSTVAVVRRALEVDVAYRQTLKAAAEAWQGFQQQPQQQQAEASSATEADGAAPPPRTTTVHSLPDGIGALVAELLDAAPRPDVDTRDDNLKGPKKLPRGKPPANTFPPMPTEEPSTRGKRRRGVDRHDDASLKRWRAGEEAEA